ncbi:caspase family protein, partial [Enterovirga sp.]|uniref:caspase family protein n=1 Tax=Enterovirga sp. TaxID=2026350 RepID=UPI002620E60F
MHALRVILVALGLLGAWHLQAAAQADAQGARVAFVVGNAAYPQADPPLASTLADAAAVAGELRRQGFAVDSGENLSKAELVARTERLLAEVRPGATVAFYFSGYGIQAGRQNYLIPTDANIWSETDIQRDGLNLSQLIGAISGRGAAAAFIIVEGANRNPYERRFRSYSTGLAPLGSLPPGVTVILSAAPGMSLRPPSGPRSPFSTELVKQMAAHGRLSTETLERTRTAVSASGGGLQVPWILSGRRELEETPKVATLPQPAVPRPPEPAPRPVAPAPPEPAP